MQIEDAVRELELKLTNHYMVGRFQIQNVYDAKKNKECVEVRLWLSQLRDCEGDFVQILRTLRTVVPVHWPVKLTVKTEI